MVSTAGGIVIAVVVILAAAVVGWIVFTRVRAHRLGLPPPTMSQYLPWNRSGNPYGPPRPATGGIIGWINSKVRQFQNRNNRSATGAYEEPLQGGSGGRRGFGPLDPDEAWDTRVGVEADAYGGYEEQELGGRGTDYAGAGSYQMNVPTADRSSPYDEDDEGRGRKPGAASGPGQNPFDDDAASSLRGVSPRPMEAGAAPPRKSLGESIGEERRSVFRENM